MEKTSSDGSGSYTIHIEKNVGLEGESPLAIRDLQKVAREGIALAGGPAAILLQIAHPKVGQGVADHSTFTTRAISRAQYTQMYIYVMIFGSTEEKAAMKAWVDKAHSRVKGGDKDTKYDAQDPELQLWVAATIYASMVASYELIYGALPPERAERVYQAYSCMGTSLQVPREMWPKNLKAFQVYWDDMIQNKLHVHIDARRVLDDLFHPKNLPLWVRPAVWAYMPIARRFTAEQLPPKIREQFYLRSTKSSRLVTSLWISTMTSFYPFAPLFIRQLPKTYSLRLVRKRMAKRGGQLIKA